MPSDSHSWRGTFAAVKEALVKEHPLGNVSLVGRADAPGVSFPSALVSPVQVASRSLDGCCLLGCTVGTNTHSALGVSLSLRR